MNRLKRKLKRVAKFPKFLYFFLSIIYLGVYVFFAYNIISLKSIETLLRFIGLILLFVYLLFFLYKGLLLLLTKKYKKSLILSLITFIFIVLMGFGSYVIFTATGTISNLKEKDKILYTSYLISLKDTELDDDSLLGMINDEDDIEGNVLANKIIKNKKLKQDVQGYDEYLEMLYDLYDKKVDAIFVSSNYVTLFSGESDFASIASDTKVVYEYSEELENEDNSLASSKSLSEPFTVLILGVDSETDGLNANAAFNGDTLILATINPTTMSATLFSIPRDTYVPIACRNGAQSKINSSAAYGTTCVIDTIEDLTGVDIDYYVKINFKGVVDLVDAMGGVEVDVEEPDFRYNDGQDCMGQVCESNSDRMLGDGMVYIPVGLSTLNGEQALAYARCRHLYLESDLARNRHQQDVIVALGKKVMNIKSYSEFKKILDSVTNNISTNMSTSQILSSYNIFKNMVKNKLNDEDFISIQKTYLETYSLPVYVGDYITSALGYYQGSLDDIIKAMNINLGKEEIEVVKTFDFSIDEEYSEYVAGKGIRTGSSNDVLSSMIGNDRATAESYCAEVGISCSFTYVDDTSDYYNNSYGADIIGAQSEHANTLIKNISSVTFYINGQKVSEIEETKNENSVTNTEVDNTDNAEVTENNNTDDNTSENEESDEEETD